MQKTILLLICIPILIFILFFFLNKRHDMYDSNPETKLIFTSGPCNSKINAYDPSEMGVKEQKWVSQNRVEIKAHISLNCAENVKQGSFKIEKDNLILVYNSPKCITCAKCMCAHELNFELINLPQKNYLIVLQRQEWSL